MTTVEELLSSAVPPPCRSADSRQNEHSSKDSTTNSESTSPAPRENRPGASACHVPPECYRPAPDFRWRDEFPSGRVDTDPLPGRCQFMFSDGRQCAMARSDIHPSLCRFHAEREEQLFGDSAPAGKIVGASLDLPELYSACGNLSSPGGVHRMLNQVARLLAQRRISRQEAATFCHLAHLLLRTISLARGESASFAALPSAEATLPSLCETSPVAASCGQPPPRETRSLPRAPAISLPRVANVTNLPSAAAPAPHGAAQEAQGAHYEHLHKAGAQLSCNQHLQDFST